ncbi:peptidylprolyl isomerase [Neisseria weixii]|uniref:Peptidylprolyl isomerase n=1 Tax=Neisseria weixii TaxID=1853276 RepID=A0A3N4MZZ3_9NEIS|nr:peptidylprolyl isomerase [Neisseria weixii]RPD87036.1 peptidylprolyl isomerase [Neisseria weixii]RPD89220.1 peptidylprolyl isomerase [Neisseria weixii]
MNVKPLMLAVVFGLSLNAVHAADVKASDSIAAVVDNDIITQRQVNEALAAARRNLPKGTQVTDAELRQQVVAQMVNQSLIVQAGKRRNIQASEAEIDAVIAQNPALKNANKRVRREIGDSIIVEKVRQQAIMENSRVSDSEVTSFINRAQQQGVALPEGEPLRQYNAQHILIKADSDNAAAAAESTIRKIYTQARSGADFAGLARQYSQDGSAANGGDLGWFSDGMMVTPFEDAVHKLKPGQVSAPVRTQFGWHIIKLNDIRESGTPEERQRNAVRQFISQQKAQQATTNLLRELHSSSFVDIR